MLNRYNCRLKNDHFCTRSYLYKYAFDRQARIPTFVNGMKAGTIHIKQWESRYRSWWPMEKPVPSTVSWHRPRRPVVKSVLSMEASSKVGGVVTWARLTLSEKGFLRLCMEGLQGTSNFCSSNTSY